MRTNKNVPKGIIFEVRLEDKCVCVGEWGRSKVCVSSMTTSRERSYRRRSPGTPQKLACVGQDGGSSIPRESVPQAVGGKHLGGRNGRKIQRE